MTLPFELSLVYVYVNWTIVLLYEHCLLKEVPETRRKVSHKGSKMMERECMEFDVVIVGAGPAGLLSLIHI